ncbi:MAG: sigma-70 family RNA polymerase sigma factor [Chloroflexota bacterium]
MSSDAELLQRARSFEHQALAFIYDSFSPGLYRYAIRLLGDTFLAEDCVAETFKRFLQALQARKGPNDYLQAYLYRIAHNWIADHYRRQPPQDELDESHPARGENPEKLVSHHIQQEQIRYALQKLTPNQQQVIVLKFLENWTNEDIARALNKPVGAVKSLQHRALAGLKRFLIDKDLA